MRDKLPRNLQSATPAKSCKSSEKATFSFIYKYLYWSVYSVFQNTCFLPLHGLKIQKSLILQCFCLGMTIFYPREKEDVFRLKFDVKRCSYNTLIATAILGALPAI